MNASGLRSTACLLIRVMIALFSTSLLVSLTASGSPPTLKLGDTPPDVLGRSSTGDRVHLSDYRGRIVIISFWATWCGPCRKELPLLVKLQKQATRDKLVVLSVNWRQSYEEFRQIQRYLKDTGSDVTLISDEYGRVGNAYGVKAIPHMIIVGRDGKIAAIHVGYDEQQIPGLVEQLNSTWQSTVSEGANRD